jgi:ferredoxin
MPRRTDWIGTAEMDRAPGGLATAVTQSDKTVVIDRTLCGSTGYCQRVAPEIFDLDAGEDGTPRVLVEMLRTPEQMEAAADAQSMCPTGAIEIVTPAP